jgi:ribosome-binding factor A
MESTRQNKISRLLQKELSDIFLLYARNIPGTLITVSSVHVSPDLSIAHANLSIFPSEKGQEVLKGIVAATNSIRFELGNKVRHQLRIIPALHFHIDDTLDYLDRIDELLKK